MSSVSVLRRFEQMTCLERDLQSEGKSCIAGVDEAGRGPLAGPVVAAACVLPYHDPQFKDINDSKQLSAQVRENLFAFLMNHPSVIWAVGFVEADGIDQVNILQATLLAMKQAILALAKVPDYLLIDGLHVPDIQIPKKAIVRGDSRSISIAAASIIAKVTRDRMMKKYHALWPLYGFDTNQGYGTEAHLKSLAQHGPCPIHRKSYQPVADSIFSFFGKDLRMMDTEKSRSSAPRKWDDEGSIK